MIEDEKMYLLPEAADFLRVSMTTMYNLVRSGTIKGYKINGKYLIPGKMIYQYLEEHKSDE